MNAYWLLKLKLEVLKYLMAKAESLGSPGGREALIIGSPSTSYSYDIVCV